MVLNYITCDAWWDTDATILPELCKKYKVNVFVVDSRDDCKYPHKEDYGFNKFIIYKPKYRNRDIRKIGGSMKFFRQIFKECKRKDAVNLFILNGEAYLVVLFYLLLKKGNTIIAAHNYKEHVDNRRNIFAYCYKMYFNKFSRYLFFSNLQMEDFLKDHPNKEAYSITMPLKDFGTPTKKRTDNKITFLFFGGIRPYKRPDLFIKAANSIPSGKAKFVMVGYDREGYGYDALIERKEDFNVENRFVDNAEIPDFFCNSDFLVLPYEDATQSGPSLIAINYGIPIIATRLTAFERIITDGENGYLFDIGDVDALTNIFKDIIEKGRTNVERMKVNMRKKKMDYIRQNNIIEVFGNIIGDIGLNKAK